MAKAPVPELHIQMVPAPLWGRNLRVLMGKNAPWRHLREALIAKDGLSCSSCGKVVELPRQLHAHEDWRYLERSEPAVAWLQRVSMICWHCHALEHPGVINALIAEGTLTERAREDNAAHVREVKGLTKRQHDARLRAAQKDFDRRNQRDWYIDYGPFQPWVYACYENDPLNEVPWSEHLKKRLGEEPEEPTMASIVESFRPDAYPTSQHGFIAMVYEGNAEATAEKRRKTLAKKKRMKLKALKEEEKARRAAARAAKEAAT